MKPIIYAFILSIILHLLIFLPIELKKEEPKKKKEEKIEKKSTLRYVKLMPKKVVVPKAEPKKEIKPIPKPKNYKVVEKKKIVPQQKKQPIKKAKKIPSSKPKKVVKKFKAKKKVAIKPQEKRKTIPNRSLENFLLSNPVPVDLNMLDVFTQKQIKTYGDEYDKFTNVQKVFIQNNLKNIVVITRRYYRFPPIAEKLQKNDYNIVEFYLYPNGDISDLRIVQKGRYSFYDKSILETIEFAYKDYPRPKVKTKIRFFITYRTY
ncbi:energy transducer TonB [Halarcobacter sp.]|uniref:energy transducer TonB family protein n=1 Tax=Halarcobacter sp. TaxID=2321133 RepID=UPI002AA82632|nr:energy transducer TonB [Halarcobacter sp.]